MIPLRVVSRFALAMFFMGAGVSHFIAPSPYLAIMPGYIPWPGAMVALSGLAEVLGGIGICFRATRRAAGWGLMALLVAVFPANIEALSAGMIIGGHVLPIWALWTRLLFQPLLIAWVYRTSARPRRFEEIIQ